MPVSSNTLFHFTNSIDNLLNIMREDFIPHFSLEKIKLGKMNFNFAYPMVCFCDIPLSQIKNHIKHYGNYGIGLTKEWGKENKLNPVQYIERNSDLSDYLSEVVITISSGVKQSKEGLPKSTLYLIKHLKQYENKDENYRYYDEREWRYLPKTEEIMDENSFIIHQRSQGKRKLANHGLRFIPNDISYIIIRDESEINLMISYLRKIKIKYEGQIDKLISRIITVDQIYNDF